MEWKSHRRPQWAKDIETYDLMDNWQGKVKWFINRAKELLAAHVVMHNKYPPTTQQLVAQKHRH